MLVRWLTNHSYRIVPGNCVICGENSHRDLDLCQPCEEDLPWIHDGCVICSLPIDPLDNLCRSCHESPPSFDRCVCPLRYEFPVDSMISRFKNHRHLASGKVLARLLGTHINSQIEETAPDVLVPTPLHPSRRRSRGYNQAEQIAITISEMTEVPIAKDCLVQIRATPEQKSLGISERKKNVKNAFTCNGDITDKHILLVDDVVTTCATINEISRCLRKEGAKEITVLALARTPPAASQAL